MWYKLWQGDLESQLALDLTGIDSIPDTATVQFVMTQADGTKRVTGAATIPDPVNAPTGVAYQWQAGDTDTPGVYRAVFKVLYAGSAPETFPSDDELYILIRPAL